MLLPQFTIRNLFFLTALCAVASLIVRQALLGSAWAIGASAGLGFLVISFLVYAILTLIVGLPAYGWQKLAADDTRPEDSDDQPAQQIIAQREGD